MRPLTYGATLKVLTSVRLALFKVGSDDCEPKGEMYCCEMLALASTNSQLSISSTLAFADSMFWKLQPESPPAV